MSDPVVTKANVMAACEGMLRKQLYVVFTTPAKGLGPVMENIEPHLAYQVELEQKGVMFGAGPFWDDSEELWEGAGMVIIRAGSLDEAKKIAAEDPMHKSGAHLRNTSLAAQRRDADHQDRLLERRPTGDLRRIEQRRCPRT